jgi:small subunit ribosomal protein S6e
MAKFKLIVSDPSNGKSSVSEVEGSRAQALMGRSLGETIDGSALGIAPSKLLISGGCDKNGVPMRADVHGGAKKYIVLSSGPGFRSTRHGERRRKLVRGRTITDDTYQINFTIHKETATTQQPTPKVEPKPEPKPVRESKPVEKKAPQKPKPKKAEKKQAKKAR